MVNLPRKPPGALITWRSGMGAGREAQEGGDICIYMYICVGQSVQSLSFVRLFATPWNAARQASLSITNSLELAQTHVH